MMFSSPFTSKFGTNFWAKDDEIAQIKALLTEPSLRLQAFDDEIFKKVEERAALQAYIDAHRAFLSPIRRMPRDVLQEIFVACIPTSRNCVMSSTEAPLILGRICSAWREIALSTAQLWSRLHIVEPYFALSHRGSDATETRLDAILARVLEGVETWLGRSGECALSISVHYAPGPDTATGLTKYAQAITQALLTFAPRWEQICFTAASGATLVDFPHLEDAGLPMLKHLEINEISSRFAEPAGWNSLSLLRAPRLTYVKIAGRNFKLLELPLRWDQLRSLCVHKLPSRGEGLAMTSEMAIQLLSKCPRLEKLEAWVQDDEGPCNTRGTLVENRSLRTLEIECGGGVPSVIGQLCGRLFLPELRDLLLIPDLPPHEEPAETSYATFLSRSPLIETVQVFSDMFIKATMVEFIRSLPNTLREFELFQTSTPWAPQLDFDGEILRSLTPSPSGTPSVIWPALEVLTLHQLCAWFSDIELREFVFARMGDGAHSKLRQIDLSFSREMEVDVLPDLKTFIDEGLHVELSYISPQTPRFTPWDGLDDRPGRG